MFKMLLTAGLLGAWTLPAWGCLLKPPARGEGESVRGSALGCGMQPRPNWVDILKDKLLTTKHPLPTVHGTGSWSDSSGQDGTYVYSLSGFHLSLCPAMTIGCYDRSNFFTYSAHLSDGRTINFSWRAKRGGPSSSPVVQAIPDGAKYEVTALRSDEEQAAAREGHVMLEIAYDRGYEISLTHETYGDNLDEEPKNRAQLLALPKSITYDGSYEEISKLEEERAWIKRVLALMTLPSEILRNKLRDKARQTKEKIEDKLREMMKVESF